MRPNSKRRNRMNPSHRRQVRGLHKRIFLLEWSLYELQLRKEDWKGRALRSQRSFTRLAWERSNPPYPWPIAMGTGIMSILIYEAIRYVTH